MYEPSLRPAVESEPASDQTIASLVALHDRDARAALRRVLGRSQEEDDLVQEVFVRLVIRLRQPGPLSVGAWVRGVAHNLAVDEIRRQRAVPVEENRLDGYVACRANERIEGAELYSNLVAGARGLPERQRAALGSVLAGHGRQGVAGVATDLGVSVHAAESLLSRARTGMRQHLATGGDRGSLPVTVGAVLGGIATLLAWLGRHWRAAVLAAGVSVAAVTAVEWPHTRPVGPPPPVTVPVVPVEEVGTAAAVGETSVAPEPAIEPASAVSAEPAAPAPTPEPAAEGAATADLPPGSVCALVDSAAAGLVAPLLTGLTANGVDALALCPVADGVLHVDLNGRSVS